MIKKLFIIFFCFISLFSFANAENKKIQVQDIFSDINSDYQYIDELQLLYDKGIIEPDNNWEFNPNRLIQRDEFVWIVSEVSCKRCMQPYTSYDLIEKYSWEKTFFDIHKNNKYSYCVAFATEKKHVVWYDEWTICENGKGKAWEKPFCPENNIILEEAIAVILRASNILTEKEAQEIRNQIYNGKNFPNLTNDITPKLEDGGVYAFYPYFQKAINYEHVEYDTKWNKTVSNILPVQWNFAYPKQNLNREDFLRIASVVLEINSCQNLKKDNLAVHFEVLNKTCSSWDSSCETATISDEETTYDFKWEVWWVCEAWVKNPSGYIWKFYNQTSWEEILKYWEYLNNYEFLTGGKWLVQYRVIDQCDNTWTSYKTLFIPKEQEKISVEITGGPLEWNQWLNSQFTAKAIWGKGPYSYKWSVAKPTQLSTKIEVTNLNNVIGDSTKFDSTTKWWTWPYSYKWDFGDGSSWVGKDAEHTFSNPWVHTVTLVVTDKNWVKTTEIIKIIVVNKKHTLSTNVSAEPTEWSFPLTTKFSNTTKWWKGPYSYEWDFGNWQTSTLENPSHKYEFPGTYTTQLIVTDKDGKKSTSSILVVVKNPLIYPQKSDNNTLDTSFLEPGRHPVTVIITDANWDISSDTVLIDIQKEKSNFSVNASASPANGVGPFSPNLNSSVSGGNGPYSYKWDFGDGKTSNQANPNHTFKNPWNYKVNVTVTDKNGNKTSDTINIQVKADPNKIYTKISADVSTGSGPLSSHFSSEISGGKWPYKYHWDFDDGTSSTDKNPKHRFTQPWIYDVVFTTTDSNGQKNQETMQVIVTADESRGPNVHIKADPIFGSWPLISNFNSSINGWKWPYTYKWNFWDGTSAYWKDAQHVFKENGNYEVELTVTDSNGRINTSSTSIKVENNQLWEKDSDNDGVNDLTDKCALIKGSIENSGCPIFEQTCGANNSCPQGYSCSVKTSGKNVCEPIQYNNSCFYNGWSAFLGNTTCNSCPCSNFLDFNASLRKCDIIFPAITSPDGNTIYEKWEAKQIQ